jgi:Fic family protein
MHLEIRKIKNVKKYYLAHSFRLDNKIRKVRHYLGSNLSKDQIIKKRKNAELIIKEKIINYKKIRDPFKTVISPTELKQLKTLEAKGNIKAIHLSKEDWKLFIEKFTYDTNAIEGSTVTPKEVSNILKKDKWPRERAKWEISETYGLAEAIAYIRNTKTHISLALIKKLHKITFKNSKSFAGKLRKKGEEVVIADRFGNIVHRGAPSTLVIRLLKDLINWYSKNKKKYPPIVIAIIVHNYFEIIHPFRDGNGRVGRLLLNNILLKHNLPPINIEMKNRAEYYHILREYQNNNNIRPSIELILKEYKNLKKMIKKR